MHLTFRRKIIIGVYIFVLLSIPVGAFLASRFQNSKSSANSQNIKKPVTSAKPTTNTGKNLLDLSGSNISKSGTGTNSDATDSASPTVPTNYGATLSIKETIEARPNEDYSTRLFVGILEGEVSQNPNFILNFTVDVPASGEYNNLSLAGLTSGTKYTALIKGSTQIATSAAFIMSPDVTNLNDGKPLHMLSGDLNQDNVINNVDYAIVQKALNSTASSSNWNDSADLNRDGVVNIFDISIVSRNNGKVGASAAWTSISPMASSSATVGGGPMDENIANPPGEVKGHWIWIPKTSN
mgnify:CR=1 FL=1